MTGIFDSPASLARLAYRLRPDRAMVKRSRLLRLHMTVALTCLLSGPGHAASTTLTLNPDRAHIGLTVFAVGVFPLTGTFGRFSGQISIDPATPGHCSVNLTVDVASLRMPRSSQTTVALGSSLLDASRYPQLRFSGNCTATGASGTLTMHGVTRPITLATVQDGNTLAADGFLMRRDYGVSALPGLIANRVDIRVRVTTPVGWPQSAEYRVTVRPVAVAAQPGSNVRAAPFMQ